MVIVLTQHPMFGYLLIPYMAEEKEEPDTIRLLEQAFHATPEMVAQLSESERKIIDIASAYTEKKLMKVYSKEKTTTAFLKAVTEKRIKESIRPFIEKKLIEALDIIRLEKLPLYQHKAGDKTLYRHDMYKIPSTLTDMAFHFEMDGETFRYTVNFSEEGEAVLLTEKKPVITLIAHPAVIITGDELHRFSHIEASRILPFTNRRLVSVDAAQINKYIENIVLPVARHHAFTSKGMPIVEEHREYRAVLSIENTIFQERGLKLTFVYGDNTYLPGKIPGRAEAFLVKKENNTVLHYYYRDLAREQKAVQLLTGLGLKLVDDCHFVLTKRANVLNLTEWLLKNKDTIQKEFLLINLEKNTTYCLDDISMEHRITEDRDWMELHMTVVIGKYRMPFLRFKKNIIQGDREFTLPDGRLVLLPEEWFVEYADLFAFSEERRDGLKMKKHFIGIVPELLKRNGKEKIFYREKNGVAAPEGLKATLRDYQKEGFNWMLHLCNHGFGGCLADDMGLGKTIQTLALLQYLYGEPAEENTAGRDEQPRTGQLSLFPIMNQPQARPSSLIVVPTSLLHNWRREIERFTTLSLFEYTGNARCTDPVQLFGQFNLILTTYGFMRNNAEVLGKYLFEYIILDESQYIKNSESLTFKAVEQLQAKRRLALTGTPIENSLKDLWSQFQFFHPGLLGNERDFYSNFILPIKQGNILSQKKLKRLISPFILRRSKQEVAPELPSLTEEIIYCEMTGEHEEIYKDEKNKLRKIILQLNENQWRYKNLTVLNGINRLRQLASHPRMIYPDFAGTSGKLEEVADVFETLQSEGHKVLIFSSYVKHLELVAETFTGRGWEYAMLTGSTVKREEEIERFTSNSHIKAFLISLKAGGVGLNLTDADYVFIIDPWWNPAAEMQAISRAHRIGQDKRVFAYRFITEDSIEGKIIKLQESKRKLSETFIEDNNPWQSLTDKEWEDLLK